MIRRRGLPGRWFRRAVLARRWTSFLALGLSFLLFGAGTANLLLMLQANFELLSMHGWMALMDGGALQLLEILATTYLSMAAYVVFKACEYRLIHGLVDKENPSS